MDDPGPGHSAERESSGQIGLSAHRKAYFFSLAVFLALWLAVYLSYSPVLSSTMLYLGGFSRAVSGFFHLTDAPAAVFDFTFSALVVLSTCYLAARLWLMSTRAFKGTVAGLALLALLSAWALRHYETAPDWTSRGLDPNRPGFKPRVVILAGTFHYWINDTSVNQIKSGNALFEIRMRGQDHYYCKKWKGDEWKVGSWYVTELAVKDFSQTSSLSYLRHTVRGGGGSWFGPEDIILARRLWAGDQFVGAKPGALVAETRRWSRQEEFSKLTRFGPFLIPRTIKLSEGNERIETYTIKRVEFDVQPSEAWFEQIRRKYFDRDPALRTANLGEPGVTPEKRARG